ncbi:MAG: cytochrome-c peroxidase [Pseudomonadales bacterium]
MCIAPIDTFNDITAMERQRIRCGQRYSNRSRLLQTALLWAAGWLLAIPGIAQSPLTDAPETRAEPLSGLTERGAYRVILEPQERDQPIPVGRLHAWEVTVETADGERFIPGQISIGGGMPAHGHGLPSAPAVTRHLGNGRFLIEGMLFNMTGAWQLRLAITGPAGLDHYVRSLQLSAPLPEPPVPEHIAELPSPETAALSPAEVAIVRSLSLSSLTLPADSGSNRLLGDPDAIALGRRLFADPGLSATGTISCSTCHQPERAFTDGKTRAFGTAAGPRNAPSLVGVRYSPWLYWDGRRDSLWAQALTPFETPGEMDNNRTDVVRYLLEHESYRPALKQWDTRADPLSDSRRFPPGAGPYAQGPGKIAWQRMDAGDRALVNSIFVLAGKALAAYEYTLMPSMTRFDRFADSLSTAGATHSKADFTAAELRGLQLFIDPQRSRCLQCHNGPLFSNQGFHNIGTGAAADGSFDYGRAFGLQTALFNPFNCRSEFSDDQSCAHVVFAQTSEQPGSMNGAFKVPGLRNLAQTGPYLHDGRHASLAEVLRWYNKPPAAADSGHELLPLDLEPSELKDLEAFLLTLSGNP